MKRALSLSLALLLLLPGCNQEEKPYHRDTFAMDTVMSLDAYGPSGQAGVDAAVREIGRLQRLLSVTDEDSEVWALNHNGGTPLAVSGDTMTLLDAAQEIGQRSNGALDVTLYPVVKAWGFTTGSYQVPSQETLTSLLTRVDYQSIGGEGDAVVLPSGMELDFGSLAKGYAGERCAQLMKDAGVDSAILSLGGNVQTVGAKPDGSPWRVLVQSPDGESGDYAGTLELIDQAAVTSGGYQRYFEENGVRYWHIIDPATGAPARSGLQSVTIVGDSGTLCDGLSTALFVLGREGALDYWRQYGGFETLLIDDDDTVWLTAGLAEKFTLNADSGFTLQIVEE